MSQPEIEIREIECPSCGGSGGMYITHDMAIDGGDRSMEGQFWGCSRCHGAGYIAVETPQGGQEGKKP